MCLIIILQIFINYYSVGAGYFELTIKISSQLVQYQQEKPAPDKEPSESQVKGKYPHDGQGY
jgi:hypothetical protein